MNKQQLETILATLVRLEHNTKHSITNDEYWNIVALCQAVEAPQFITEYFATKANSAQSWQSSDKPYGVYQCIVALFWKVLIMEKIINSLTLEQAYTWFNLTDKWVWIDDTILAANDLKATDDRVNAIEDRFEELLLQAEIDGMRL